ncbi:uncharacterized protein LOC117122062, partial [Anneissia japonica]|uniref:uncharacterized protein LOC117122062 n=1 Tax=Anneissia japonica TaxID=1529436 RepID=UPI001425690A
MLRIPELPQILQKLEHTTPPNQFQRLSAALKPLKPKTDVDVGQDLGQKSDGNHDGITVANSEDASTPGTRRRRKLPMGIVPLDAYSNGDKDRWKSDPTSERHPQNSSVNPCLLGTASTESVDTPSSRGYAGSVVSTESSLSNSSLATSISETIADQGFLHVMEEVAYQPGGI